MTASTTGRYGLRYHIVPPKGLLNDPNGLIYWKGEYHVFFQWNPYHADHTHKDWGHLISKDMVEWKRLPVALEANDWFDKNGVYSGSAIEKDGELWLFYTGNVKDEQNVRSTYQCLAVSKDGIHFEKKGPLFEYPAGYTAHVRDPKVWFDSRVGHYWMVLGAQLEREVGDTIIYASKDLLNWEFKGSIVPNHFELGYMWECPDIVQLGSKDVFIYSPQGLEAQGDHYQNIFQTVYQTGQFSETGQFIFDDAKEYIELDAGFEFYAPQTFVDGKGRVIQYGWMGTMPPEIEASVPTVADGWIHALTIPRVLSYKDNQLFQQPVDELKQLRQSERIEEIDCPLHEFHLDSLQEEIVIEWATSVSSTVKISLCDEIEIVYSSDQQRLTVERTNWLSNERETRSRVLTKPLQKLHLFIDSSSLELFVNDGREVFSLRYFLSNEAPKTGSIEQVEASSYQLSMYRLNETSFIQGE